MAAQNIKFQAYVGKNKDNNKRYEMCFNKTQVIKGGTKYSFKAKDGLLRPCLLKSKTKTEASIIFIRCGKTKVVNINCIIPYQEELVDKPYRHVKNDKYTSVLNQLFV